MDFPLPMILHFILMTISLICFITAFFIARKKKGTTWLKRHRFVATTGVMFVMAGFLTMLAYYIINDYPNFESRHAVNGLAAFLISAGTLIIGYMILKGKKKARPVHRFLGRTGIILVILAVIFGIIMII